MASIIMKISGIGFALQLSIALLALGPACALLALRKPVDNASPSFLEKDARLGQKKPARKEWTGCHCENFDCSSGLDIPVACARKILQTAKIVPEVLDAAGIPHWLEGGSLIGSQRLGGMMP